MSSVQAHRGGLLAFLPATLFALVALLSIPASAAWIDLGGDPVTVTVLEAAENRTVLEVSVGGFSDDPVTIDGETYHQISLGREPISLEQGLPALPAVKRSITIPDDRLMRVKVVSSEFVDYPNMPVIPSKGNLTRDIDPKSVPYSFSSLYTAGGTYPSALAEGGEPYILRDVRGMVVEANVFQYLASTATLRVYTSMVIEVSADGPDTRNVFSHPRAGARVDRQFARLYEDHFVDFAYRGPRYTPVLEDGGILIITYDAFRASVEPLYQWKLQKGMPAKLVNLSQVGSTSTAILNYIISEYQQWQPAYVLLIGDATQVPTVSYSSGSDPSYALVVGTDSYPDLFVGRFSAETAAQVLTQVDRTIAYERDIVEGQAWPQYGTGIASNQGTGDDGEYDNQHEDNIRADLLAYGYLGVDQIYDPSATAQMVTNALNQGRGIVNYTGHGSTTSWSTTGFSTTQVSALTNDLMNPFICSVACLNGNFVSSTCFAEAWLRASHNGVPTGAIACYMSTISQSWDPPMSAQDEAIDLLVADEMRTIGGLWFNGSCLMMDEYGSSGVNEFKCWTIFGDPSVAVRTKAAQAMAVDHPGVLLIGTSEYGVDVTGVTGALCALYADGVLYGSARTDAAGHATIALDPAPAQPLDLTLTVTAYNKVTYEGLVQVIPPAGAYLLVQDTYLADGNDDQIVNAGESLGLSIQLRNVGISTALDVTAQLTSPSEFLTIDIDTRSFGNIKAGASEWGHGSYPMMVSPLCPDQEQLVIPILISGSEDDSTRSVWNEDLRLIVQAPVLTVDNVWVDDSENGNGNGRLDPGESAHVGVMLKNSGHYGMTNITGTINSNHPEVSIASGAAELAELGYPASAALAPDFEITLSPDYAQPFLFLTLHIAADLGYDKTFDLTLPIGGFLATFESGADGWTHDNGGGTWIDQWHLSTQRNHSPGGGQSWKCGATDTASYGNLLNACLLSIPLDLTGEGELRFWMWMDAETSATYPGMAYDGGILEMSLDGGAFTQITPEGGYTHSIRAGSTPGPFAAGTAVYSGQMDWRQVTVDLSGIVGSAVFRFRFGSDGADGNEGWYVDDVELWTGMAASDTRDEAPQVIRLALSPSAPNPSRGEARIGFALPHDGAVSVEIFDATGRLVRSLLDEEMSAGEHAVVWDGRDGRGESAASGIYFYRLTTPEGMLRRSMVLSR